MLNVKIYSFGFQKSGIPEDETPNHGGFVFDLRYINNPRWVDELKNLTGKDDKVIKFLDAEKLMQDFLINANEIIVRSIENYISRDFTNLMICFGCTGGQHRSIYTAEKTASYLKKIYKKQINISITHIEYPELSSK